MKSETNIFSNKKILIYGIGKSGLASFKFLKNKNDVFLYDDFNINVKNLSIRKNLVSYQNVLKSNFDQIIISPGIDIKKCKLSKFLKKNKDKIYSDLDVFYEFYKNDCITITGTNGKSTTCQLLYEVLIDQKYNVRLVGNIGNPILSIKNIKKHTIFVIEASSYQLEYSKIFRSKFAMILNLSPDHIERHKTLNNYINAKFKLLKNQLKGHFALVKKDDLLINKKLRQIKLNSKIKKVDTKKNNQLIKNIDNQFFFSESNRENLSFILELSKKFKLKKNILIRTIKKFKGLKYRQEIIFKTRYLTIINDSKSTSFSSSIGILRANQNIYWLLGGVYKKGDKFNLSKNHFKKIKAFIFGKNIKFFQQKLKGKIQYEKFNSLKQALKKVISITEKQKLVPKTILFSPCAASFDSFKNFEDRGFYFNKLIGRYFNGKQKINI